MTTTHHPMDYIEINVSDLAATRAFYAQAFGWEFNDYGPEYSGIRSPSGDGEIGGLNAAGDPGPGGPFLLLRSSDIDASVAAVTAAGGTVIEGPYDYPGGRRFHFSDPSGNVLGVYHPAH